MNEGKISLNVFLFSIFLLSAAAILILSQQLPAAFAANGACGALPPPPGAACQGEACGGAAANGSTPNGATCQPAEDAGDAAKADPNKTSVCQGGSGSGLTCTKPGGGGGGNAGGGEAGGGEAANGEAANAAPATPPSNDGAACTVQVPNAAPAATTTTATTATANGASTTPVPPAAASPSTAVTPTPSPTPAPLMVTFQANNNSGETGTAVLQEANGQTTITLNMTGSPANGAAQSANIQMGTCPATGNVVYALNNLTNGTSTSVITATLAQITGQLPLAINVGQAATAGTTATILSCGNIPAHKTNLVHAPADNNNAANANANTPNANGTSATGTCGATCPNGQTAIDSGGFCTSGNCCVTVAHFALHAHLEGIGLGVTTTGKPENANPTQKTVTGTMSIQGHQQLSVPLTYNPKTGLYENLNLQVVNLAAGVYNMIFHLNKYIDRPVVTDLAGTTTVVTGVTVVPGTLEMVTGDIAPAPQGDNIVDLQDYNSLLGCMSKTAMCPNSKIADLNDDGTVDQKDLDLLQSHFGAIGAAFLSPKFVCSQDPNCKNGSSTIQLCPLNCKIQIPPPTK